MSLSPQAPLLSEATQLLLTVPCRSFLVNKQVIATSSGRQLGYIAQLWVDPATLQVLSLDLKPDRLPLPATLGSTAEANVLLQQLRQNQRCSPGGQRRCAIRDG